MTQLRLIALVIAATAFDAVAADPSVARVTTLYCSGKTWQSIATTSEVSADAVVRIAANSFQIEISAVAAGRSSEAPQAVGGISVTGSLMLTRAHEGGGQVSVGYSLNRYSGDLVVYPGDSNGRAFFVGTCKTASPLF